MKKSIDDVIQQSDFSEKEFLNHLLQRQDAVKGMEIEPKRAKVFLDFLLRVHLASAMPIKPFPEPLYATIPGEIVYHGGLVKFNINTAAVKVSVKL